VWAERALLWFHRQMFEFDRPDRVADHYQAVPGALKVRAFTTLSVIDALTEMVRATESRIGTWEIPWHSPTVEVTAGLDPEHPVDIAFEHGRTIIRIEPALLHNPDGTAAMLAHALAHYVMSCNVAPELLNEDGEYERMTDLFVFLVGLGRLYLPRAWAGQPLDEPALTRRSSLPVPVMGYLHARCGRQHDQELEAILEGIHGGARDAAVRTVLFLTGPRQEPLEVLVCRTDHVLVVPQDASGAVHCRCGWRYGYRRTRIAPADTPELTVLGSPVAPRTRRMGGRALQS
jgi:hypothetical protein